MNRKSYNNRPNGDFIDAMSIESAGSGLGEPMAPAAARQAIAAALDQWVKNLETRFGAQDRLAQLSIKSRVHSLACVSRTLKRQAKETESYIQVASRTGRSTDLGAPGSPARAKLVQHCGMNSL